MGSHCHVIMHLPAKNRRNRTIGGGVMTSYRHSYSIPHLLRGSGLVTASV